MSSSQLLLKWPPVVVGVATSTLVALGLISAGAVATAAIVGYYKGKAIKADDPAMSDEIEMEYTVLNERKGQEPF